MMPKVINEAPRTKLQRPSDGSVSSIFVEADYLYSPLFLFFISFFTVFLLLCICLFVGGCHASNIRDTDDLRLSSFLPFISSLFLPLLVMTVLLSNTLIQRC